MYANSNKRKNSDNFLDASKSKKKKSLLSLKQKEEVIKSIEEHGLSAEKVATDNNLSISTVYKILRNKEQLLKFTKNYPNSAIRKALKSTQFPELEKALLEWFNKQKLENQPITQIMLALKSRELYEQIYKRKENVKPFKGSFGFIQKFCRRNQISLKSTNSISDSNENPDSNEQPLNEQPLNEQPLNERSDNERFSSLNDACPSEQMMRNSNNSAVDDIIIENNDILFQSLPLISSSEVIVYCKYLINWLDFQIDNSIKIKEHLEKLIDLAKNH